AADGSVTAWNANLNGLVRAVAVSDSTVYAGGEFFTAGGLPRTALAALDARTGGTTPWNPDPNGIVRAVTPSGSMIYAGGDFTSMANQAAGLFAGIRAAPDARAIQPASGGNTGIITVTVVGYNLQSGAAVTLSRQGGTDIPSSDIVV